MPLKIYSTLSRQKETFSTLVPGKVTMYLCGPTVYKPSHIGHMVGPVIFDSVTRYLTYVGYSVDWVVNITDVDDKLINRARESKTTVKDLAERMTADYQHCLKTLNVTRITRFPKATEHIEGMVAMIGQLIAKGYAYPAAGDVYFDVSKDEDYGKLCNRDPEQLEAGARIEVTDRKRNPGDFALWKGAKKDEPADVVWPSPWGPGRPGWHIECSVMSSKLLGDTIDIHGGGLDLQFPHHENELAQSESATGKTFAKYWMHNGLLKMGKGKMAGSVGNVINVADAVKQIPGEVLRFFLLSTHYRSPIDLGDWDPAATTLPPGLETARRSYEAFFRFGERYHRITGKNFLELPAPEKAHTTAIQRPEFQGYKQRFLDFMDDDFNTGGAVGVLFELLGSLNRFADVNKLEEATKKTESVAEFLEGATLFKELGQILGLFFEQPKADLGGDDKLVAGLMQLLIDVRNGIRAEAKKITSKDDPVKKGLFDQTDLIRKRLAELNVTLEDRAGGTTWRVG